MATTKKVTAADIAAFANQPKATCAWLPTIPEFDAVVEAYAQGVQPSVLARFLRDECGHDDPRCNSEAIGDYLRRRHPRAAQ